jgi:hypothetical protein
MRYSYVLRYQDYKNAQALYRKHRLTASLTYYVWIWILPVVGLAVALPLLLGLFGYSPEWASTLAPFSAMGIWFAVFIPVMRFYSVRKCWKRLLPENVPKSVKSEISVELEMTEEQIISILPGTSEGRFYWSSILDFAEDDRIALVFVKKKVFIFIPRSALPAQGWDELRYHLTKRGVPA